jgi:hypothetical protein
MPRGRSRSSRNAPLPLAVLVALLPALVPPGCAHLPGRPPFPLPGSTPGKVREAGNLEVRLSVLHAETPHRALGPVVVYLEGGSLPREPGAPGATVRSREEDFEPAFVAAGPGQTLRLENPGPLQHELFALSPEGRLSVSLPPESSAELSLPARDGTLHFYCRQHADEHFLVYVAPTSYFARVEESGTRRLEGVPEGEYVLAMWSEAVEGPVRAVRIAGGRTVRETIWLDARLLPER